MTDRVGSILHPIGAAFVAAGLALVAILPGAAYASGAEVRAGAVLAAETQLLESINGDREAHGLAPLQYDPALAIVARWRSADTAGRDTANHSGAAVEVFEVQAGDGIAQPIAGADNAVSGAGEDATTGDERATGGYERAVNVAFAGAARMSAPHRAATLRPDYSHAGIGVAATADGRLVYTLLVRADS